MAFTVGSQLLVAPPPNPESPQDYDVCLPAGGWYDYWTGLAVDGAAVDGASQTIQSASQATNEKRSSSIVVKETPQLDKLPVFVRAGSILPRQPLVQSTAQTPVGALQIDVYPGADCHGQLYADDGHSMAYRKQGFLRQTLRCTVSDDGVRIDFAARDGRFKPWWKQLAVTIHGWEGAGYAMVGGRRIEAVSDRAARTLRFTIADQPKAASIDALHQ
jgi:alpha-glucosidase